MRSTRRPSQLSEDDKLSEAIASLEASLRAVPTATARETLALFYQKAGNRDGAIQLAEQAVSEARESGDAVKTAKAERLLGPSRRPLNPWFLKRAHRMQGSSGLSWTCLQEATTSKPTLLVPCVYSGQFDVESSQPEVLQGCSQEWGNSEGRSQNAGADAGTTSIRLHGPNGGHLGGWTAYGGNNVTQPLEYKADQSGAAYVSLSGGVRGSALEISVR